MVCLFTDVFHRPNSELENGWVSRGSSPGSPGIRIGVRGNKAVVIEREAQTIVNADAVRQVGSIPRFAELEVGNWTATPSHSRPIVRAGHGLAPFEIPFDETTKRGAFVFWVSAAYPGHGAPPNVFVGDREIPHYNPGISVDDVTSYQGIGRCSAGNDHALVVPSDVGADGITVVAFFLLVYGYDNNDVNVGGNNWIIAPGGVPFFGTEQVIGPYEEDVELLVYAAGNAPVFVSLPPTDPPSGFTAGLADIHVALDVGRQIAKPGPARVWGATGTGRSVCGQRQQEVVPPGTVAYVFIGSDYGDSVMDWTGVTVSVDGDGWVNLWIVKPGGFLPNPSIIRTVGDFALVGAHQAETDGRIDSRTIRLHRTLRPSGVYLYSATIDGLDYELWDDGDDLVGTYNLWGRATGFALNSTNAGPTPEATRFTTDGCLAPQRQFPRDDGLAVSLKRGFPQPTTTQTGLRRGPTAIT